MSTATTTATPERLTVDRVELARILGISPKTLDRNRDDLPTPLRVGNRLLWSKAEVLDFLREKKVRPA